MLRILNKNKEPVTAFTRYKNLSIKSVLHKYDQTMNLEARYRDVKVVLEAEGYIETREERYVIKEINPESKGTVKITAALDLESLEGKAWHFFESVEQTVDDALRLAIAGTGWTVGECEITKKRTLRTTNKSALDIIRQAESTYRCEIILDSKNRIINIFEAIGIDRGVYLKTGLNMQTLSVSSDTYDFFTEIEPYGKGGMTIAEVNDGIIYLENHQYAAKAKRIIWKDDRYTVAESLKEDAAARLADMSKPYISYKVKAIDLPKALYAKRTIFETPEGKLLRMPNGRMLTFDIGSPGTYDNLVYGLGDVITLLDPETGTREKQRIVEMTVYPEENGNRDSCTLANMVLTFDEAAQRFQDSAETVSNITSDNGTVSGASIDSVSSDQVSDFDEAVGGTTSVTNLTAEYVTVNGKLTAVEADIGTLTANVGQFEQLTAENFTAVNADIALLRANYADIALARISVLEATSAQITSLLAGTAVATEAQMIHLNALNATIDTAFLRSLIASNISVNDLKAGRISTDTFQIGSDDSGILISGNTQTFRDADGNVRLQIGEDALGDFTFILYGADGSGVLIDQDGLHESALAEGLIRDAHVAANANIDPSKVNISKLWDIMLEDDTHQWNATQIVMDEDGQTLRQSYIQMAEQMRTNTQVVTSAEAAARAAEQSAQAAITAIEGISTLDAFSVQLSADAATVSTAADGSGGNYGHVYVTAKAIMGETDVTSQSTFSAAASSNVQGIWSALNRRYQVTGMTENDGWVDITAEHGQASVTKRFTISKSLSGEAGVVYSLRLSTDVIRRSATGILMPPHVTLRAAKIQGEGEPELYEGFFLIERSEDGETFTEVHRSQQSEMSHGYAPGPSTLVVRCSLLSESGGLLDQKNILILTDASELAGDVEILREGVTTVSNRVSAIETGMDGLLVNLGEVETEVHRVTDGSLDFQPTYEVTGGNVIATAHLYKSGTEVTREFPAQWYEWHSRNDDGRNLRGTGYQLIMPMSYFGYNGGITARFILYNEAPVIMPASENADGGFLVMPDGFVLAMDNGL